MRGVKRTMWRIEWSEEEDKEMSLRTQTALKIKLLTKRDLKLQETNPSW